LSITPVLFWKENGLKVFEHKVLKILFGTKAGEIEQTGIPATFVDLCWEGVWFESHLEDQISWQFF
jgi:hypothetical protein